MMRKHIVLIIVVLPSHVVESHTRYMAERPCLRDATLGNSRCAMRTCSEVGQQHRYNRHCSQEIFHNSVAIVIDCWKNMHWRSCLRLS